MRLTVADLELIVSSLYGKASDLARSVERSERRAVQKPGDDVLIDIEKKEYMTVMALRDRIEIELEMLKQTIVIDTKPE